VKVAVLDHGMGNLRSVAKALEAAGADVTVTAAPAEIAGCDALCVPGQGIFGRCMSALSEGALADVVADWVAEERPFLGICLGMQVLFDTSEEGGDVKGLGIIEGTVRRLPPDVRVPHIGWAPVGDDYFYFDHSYAAHPANESVVTGWCEHGEAFAAAIRSGSILGVQFHPEKSSTAGIQLLREWVQG
jgi:imidazole glycerol phosphate synthase glutamine amidotransferase subunit